MPLSGLVERPQGGITIVYTPRQEVFASAFAVQGSGNINLITLLFNSLVAPLNGFSLVRFTLRLSFTFNPNLIWNATSAANAQFRGGRILLSDYNGIKADLFVDRTTQVYAPFFMVVPGSQSQSGGIGGGSRRVTLYLESEEQELTSVFYGLEPGVSMALAVEGSVQPFYNPQNLYRFEIFSGNN